MDVEHRIRLYKLLLDLQDLMKKHGASISSCGCCNGPQINLNGIKEAELNNCRIDDNCVEGDWWDTGGRNKYVITTDKDKHHD